MGEQVDSSLSKNNVSNAEVPAPAGQNRSRCIRKRTNIPRLLLMLKFICLQISFAVCQSPTAYFLGEAHSQSCISGLSVPSDSISELQYTPGENPVFMHFNSNSRRQVGIQTTTLNNGVWAFTQGSSQAVCTETARNL